MVGENFVHFPTDKEKLNIEVYGLSFPIEYLVGY